MIGKEDLNSVLRPPTSVSTSDRTLKTSNFKRTNISSKSQKKPSLIQKKVNPSPVLSKSNKSSLPGKLIETFVTSTMDWSRKSS